MKQQHRCPVREELLLWYLLRIVGYLILLPAMACADTQSRAGRDTVKLDLQQAEVLFQQRNLRLLASKFDIDAAKAAVVQAKLWSNPNLSIGQNIYNQNTRRWFDVTAAGNTDVQIQQLFLLAGKRGHLVRLAEIGSTVAEAGFEDLLRSLDHDLHLLLYDLYFLQQSEQFYDESIPSVQKTVDATEVIYQQRAVLLSEVLRLKSLLFTLQNERLNIVNDINDKETELRVLLGDSSKTYFLPEISQQALQGLQIDSLSEDSTLKIALAERPDLKTAEMNLQSADANLALQQSLAIPDITIGGSWSRAGGYITNYTALTMSVDLPLFNRNQGNIEEAEAAKRSSILQRDETRRRIEKEVVTAYERVMATEKLYQATDKNFMSQYRQLVNGTIANYQNRNISIIEFTDFFEAYRTSMLQVNQLQNDRIDALEELNYTVNKKIIKLPGE